MNRVVTFILVVAPFTTGLAIYTAGGPVTEGNASSAPATLYREKYRPQFHVTARQWTVHKLNPGQREEGWINDNNGLIYHKGQ
jgi:sucrose-6-phosphate hydrolase SacC (GH32 family)